MTRTPPERTISEPFVARTHVVHLVKTEHEPYSIYPNNIRTMSIVSTACGIGTFQGLPIPGLVLSADRYCAVCEARMSPFTALLRTADTPATETSETAHPGRAGPADPAPVTPPR
jgi:hypothetical protein